MTERIDDTGPIVLAVVGVRVGVTERIDFAEQIVICIVRAERGMTQRVGGTDNITASVVNMGGRIAAPVVDGFGARAEIVLDSGSVSIGIHRGDHAAVLVVLRADGREAAGVLDAGDVMREPRVFVKVLCDFVLRGCAVDEFAGADEVAGGVVFVAHGGGTDGIVGGVEAVRVIDVRDASVAVTSEDEAASAVALWVVVRNAVVREVDVVINMTKFRLTIMTN